MESLFGLIGHIPSFASSELRASAESVRCVAEPCCGNTCCTEEPPVKAPAACAEIDISEEQRVLAHEALEVARRHKLSGRCLEFVCTYYHQVRRYFWRRPVGRGCYECCDEGEGEAFDYKASYDDHLTRFHKSGFDPFSRGGADGAVTVSKLRFMWWAYVNGVMSFAHRHSEEVEAAMKNKSKIKPLKAAPVEHIEGVPYTFSPFPRSVFHLSARLNHSR